MGANVSIQWKPNWKEQLQREVVRNLTPRFADVLRGVTCPEHGEHPRVDGEGDSWRITACCETAAKMGHDAIAAAFP